MEAWQILTIFGTGFPAGIFNTMAAGGTIITLPILNFSRPSDCGGQRNQPSGCSGSEYIGHRGFPAEREDRREIGIPAIHPLS
jgi:hypothetical protein